MTSFEHLTAVAVQRFHPQPGDVLVIRGLDPSRADDFLRNLIQGWQDLAYQIPVLVIPKGATVTLETIEQLKREMEDE